MSGKPANTELQNLIERQEKEEDPIDEEQQENLTHYLDKVKGFCAVLGSCLSAVVSYTTVQLLQRAIPDFELNALRYTPVVVFLLPVLVIKRIPILVQKDEIWGTAAYGLLFFLESITTYAAVTFIPVAHLDAIKISLTVASGLVFFSLFWEEKITALRTCFVFVCIGGISCVTQPNFIFFERMHTTANVWTIDMVSINETVESVTNSEINSRAALTIMAYLFISGIRTNHSWINIGV